MMNKQTQASLADVHGHLDAAIHEMSTAILYHAKSRRLLLNGYRRCGPPLANGHRWHIGLQAAPTNDPPTRFEPTFNGEQLICRYTFEPPRLLLEVASAQTLTENAALLLALVDLWGQLQ